MNKISKITSVVLSVLFVIYFVLFFVIYKNNSYRIEFSLEWYWIIFSASVVLLHLTSTFFAKSVVADYISLASLLPYVCFSEITYVIRIVLLLAYGAVYLYHINRVVKMLVCVSITAFLTCSLTVMLILNGWADSLLDSDWADENIIITTEKLYSVDRSKVAEIYFKEYKETIRPDLNYEVTIYFSSPDVIDLGPVKFSVFYNDIIPRYEYKNKPDINVKWTDNNTFVINGEAVVVK